MDKMLPQEVDGDVFSRREYDPATSIFRTDRELSQWYQGQSEPVLEPDLPIVDTHHHLWSRASGDYLMDDFLSDTGSGHHVIATVFVEGGTQHRADGPAEMRPVGETEFVIRATENTAPGICAGIVGYADLSRGERVRPILEAHIAAAKGRFRGVRYPIRWDSEGIGMWGRRSAPGRTLDPDFRAGLTQLAPLGLSFDAFVYHSQFDELADLTAAFPTTSFVVNHVGGPLGVGRYAGQRAEVFEHWRQGLARLAIQPNVFIKLGGLGMLYSGFEHYQQPHPPTSAELAEAWSPYIEECLGLFGVDRCMFESNFPVDKQSCSYLVLWNAFKRITSRFSAEEKSALYAGTGCKVYKLGKW